MVEYVNPLNWNIIKRAAYTAQIVRQDARGYDYLAIGDVQVVSRSPIMLVGVGSTKSEKHWKTGCWASQYLPFIPSSTTEFSANIRDPLNIRCQLGVLNLCQFPYSGVSPFILNLSFPYWLEQASIEVWQYGESMTGEFEPPQIDSYTLAQQLELIARRDVPSDYTVSNE